MSSARLLTRIQDSLRASAIFAVLSCLLCLGNAPAAHADEAAYYIAPQALRVSFQMGYSEKSPERNFPVKSPLGKFTSASGGFRYDPSTMTLTGLRLIISSGSIATSDKSFTWKLLGPDMFDVNNFEEIALDNVHPITFVDGQATINARISILGRPKPLTMTAKLSLPKDGSSAEKTKLVGLTLRGTILCDDYNMQAKDNVGRSLGDQISFLFDMQGTRQ